MSVERRPIASISWHLRRMLLIGGAWFGVLGALYLLTPPLEPGLPIALVNFGVALACFVVTYLDVRLDGRWAFPLTFAAATCVSAAPLSVVGFSGDPDQSVVIVISMVAGAGIIPSALASTYFTLLLGLGWLVLRPAMLPAQGSHWLINVAVAGGASVVIALTRERFVRTIVALAQQGDEAREMLVAQTHEIADARDAALESARAKGRFLANMSHEIRTPLNGIVGMLSLLRRTRLSTEQAEFVSEVVRSSELLMAIVNDILDVSKIEAGAVELELVAFDIAQLIEEVASAHAATALHRGIELIADVDANLPKQVVGDPLRVRQVITNLVSNAIKFTSDGEVVLTVQLVDSPRDGVVRLRLAVTDTGVGIAADKLLTIFNPFSQADTSTTRRFGGTGLGLSICRQLVELMGSELEVSSMLGQGSSFSFALELEKEDLLTTRGLTVNARLWHAHVLVMDASERMRLTLKSQLGAWGVESVLTQSPADAVQAVRGRAQANEPSIDVAIVDVASLGQPAARAAQELGAVLAPLGCVMVAMGASLGELRQQLEECGFVAELPKPIHRNRLLDALNTALAAEPIVPVVGAPPSERPRSPSLSEGGHEVSLNGRTVLVVEDNETNQRVAVAQLRALGFASVVVGDGAEALRLLRDSEHGFWCVLMDGQMPVMDGYEATAEVRALEQRSGRERLPIIALTANAMPGDREKALDAGMDAYLAKPFTLDQLEAALQIGCASAPGSLPSRMATDSPEWRETLDMAVVEQLKALEEVSPGFFAQVVETYLGTSDENVRDLLAASTAGDLHTVQRRAHALVGSSRQVGAMHVGQLCATIEHAAALDDVAHELAELSDAVHQAQQALLAVVRAGA
ncbi:MAG: response regulator [Sandaracinaceae bacterium]|nr:response regulator [Sandaracinaceae bacterium]